MLVLHFWFLNSDHNSESKMSWSIKFGSHSAGRQLLTLPTICEKIKEIVYDSDFSKQEPEESLEKFKEIVYDSDFSN